MSDHIIYGVIGLVLGAILGGLSMGIVCGKEYRKTIEKLQDENDRLRERKRAEKTKELDDRTKVVEKKERELIKMERYSQEDDDEDEEGEDLELGDDFDSDADVDFDDPFSDSDDSEDSDEDSDDDGDKVIKLIDKKQYDEDLLLRDSETLTFYQKDGILADSFDEPIPNQTDIIGYEAVEKASDTDEETIYVSNDFEEKIYEIVVEHNESFYRDIGV